MEENGAALYQSSLRMYSCPCNFLSNSLLINCFKQLRDDRYKNMNSMDISFTFSHSGFPPRALCRAVHDFLHFAYVVFYSALMSVLSI